YAVRAQVVEAADAGRVVRRDGDLEGVGGEDDGLGDATVVGEGVERGLPGERDDVGGRPLVDLLDDRGAGGERLLHGQTGVVGLQVVGHLLEDVGERGGREDGERPLVGVAGAVGSLGVWRAGGEGEREGGGEERGAGPAHEGSPTVTWVALTDA